MLRATFDTSAKFTNFQAFAPEIPCQFAASAAKVAAVVCGVVHIYSFQLSVAMSPDKTVTHVTQGSVSPVDARFAASFKKSSCIFAPPDEDKWLRVAIDLYCLPLKAIVSCESKIVPSENCFSLIVSADANE